MAHPMNGTPHPEHGHAAHLPAARPSAEAAVEAVRFDRPPSFAGDLVRSLDEASAAVTALANHDGASDVSVSALTALVCTGATVTVSSRDPETGEFGGSTHHTDRRPR
ncbi:hypothetical protein [Streptomyces sp. NPDC056820]|uniref:hypothetical protein n=1 Tax=Streptomyces sp. NPDC056820 TaxID=3345951 RepID=UPI0036BAB97E